MSDVGGRDVTLNGADDTPIAAAAQQTAGGLRTHYRLQPKRRSMGSPAHSRPARAKVCISPITNEFPLAAVVHWKH